MQRIEMYYEDGKDKYNTTPKEAYDLLNKKYPFFKDLYVIDENSFTQNGKQLYHVINSIKKKGI